MIKLLDMASSALILAFSGLHIYIGAPALMRGEGADAVWFFGTGLAMLFCGLLNLSRARRDVASPDLSADIWTFALLAALSLFGTVLYFAIVLDAWLNPVIIGQFAGYGGMIAGALLRRPKRSQALAR